ECLSIDACKGATRAPGPTAMIGASMPSPACLRRNDEKRARQRRPKDGNRRGIRTLLIENSAFYFTCIEDSSLSRLQPGQTARQGLVAPLVVLGQQPAGDELAALVLHRLQLDLTQGV